MHIGRREASYLPTTGSESPLLLYSNSRRFPIFQARNSRTKSPAFESRGPTDRPTNLPPPVRPPAHSPASVHRTVIFGQNRTVSYLNVSLAPPPIPFHRWSEAICTPFFNEGRPFSSSSSTPLDGEMEAVSLDLLSFSFYLSFSSSFFGERRFGN